MLKILTFLAVTWPILLFSDPAVAYQYGYYAPAQYATAPAFYRPYPPVPPRYYPVYRYPAQSAYHQPRQQAQDAVINTSNTQTQAATENHNAASVYKQATGDQIVDSLAQKSGKKREFMTALLPYIEQENRRLLAMRNTVIAIIDKLETNARVDVSGQQQLKKLAVSYRVEGDPLQDKAARDELLRKIDIIPASLALAQAANESAWGDSRFAQEANNLFGIWTYDQAKGLKPKNRENGKAHLVRIFDDIGASVRYYMYNLNSHHAYRELREIRQQLRATGKDINGYALAAGLEKYSAQGRAYIELIRDLIEQNEWALLDTDNLRA